MKRNLLLLAFLSTISLFAQVGVGTTTPNGALDVSSSTNGFVPPRVSLTSTALEAPVVNPQGGAIPAGTIVWNTATDGASPNNVAPGLYYWNGTRWVAFAGSPGGLDWSLTGNSGTTAGTNFLGTTDAQDVRFHTNNLERARILSGGNIAINSAGNATDQLSVDDVDYPINAYGTGTATNHTAIYGSQAGMGSVLWGENFKATSDATAAVFGESELTIDPGIEGRNNFGNDNSVGVYGRFNFTGNRDGTGVYGQSQPAAGWGYGVVGEGNSYGVAAFGDLGATGAKTFIIDHPLDPENKTLKHFSIESNEILNMYRGNATFDSNGNAKIQLPNYFNAINKDFSYQLTPVGAAMPNLYIAEKVNNNGSFIISGGVAGKEVSWSIYAQRNDKYVQEHPEKIIDEIEKKDYQKGKYFDPTSWKQPKEKGIFYRKVNTNMSKESQKDKE